MRRFVPSLVLVTVVLLTGCHPTYRWQPSIVSQVPDNTPVRFTLPSASREIRGATTVGRSLGWQSNAARLVTSRGDTVLIPRAATLAARLKNKTGHPVAGAIVGAVIGVGVEIANCRSENLSICGEENPTELLFAGAGALIGALIKTEKWIRVRWE